MPKVLQVNFKLTVPADEWNRIAESLTETFANLAGMQWKIWMLNEETGEAGGVYLFESDAALQAFLNGPIPPQIAAAPFLTNLSVKHYDVMAKVSAATRAPVPAIAAI